MGVILMISVTIVPGGKPLKKDSPDEELVDSIPLQDLAADATNSDLTTGAQEAASASSAVKLFDDCEKPRQSSIQCFTPPSNNEKLKRPQIQDI